MNGVGSEILVLSSYKNLQFEINMHQNYNITLNKHCLINHNRKKINLHVYNWRFIVSYLRSPSKLEKAGQLIS
jgi:hypothetical protein